MDDRRLALIADVLAGSRPRAAVDRLLDVVVEEFRVSAASVAVVEGGQHLGTIASSGSLAAVVDELQFSLGEGPFRSLDGSAAPLLEPDLSRAVSFWPAFGPAAVAAGAAAAFAFPLRVGTVGLGVLSLYRDSPGDLAADELADLIAVAHVATHLLLDVERDLPPGFVPERMRDVLDHRANIHQATGMIAAQLGGDVATALGRLRAYAWSQDRPVGEVADDVIARRLRFDPVG